MVGYWTHDKKGNKYFFVPYSTGWDGLYLTKEEVNKGLDRYMTETYGKDWKSKFSYGGKPTSRF